MKIAITAAGEGWDAPVDERFGRAKSFAIVTMDDDERQLHMTPNTQNLHAAQGAGIQAAQTVADQGVTVLLTGHVGPKAYRALAAGKIEIYSGISGNVKSALEDYLAGKLTKTTGADVEGHW